MSEILRARGVRKTYESGNAQIEVLKGINLTVEKGEYIAIKGDSCDGKTTLASILSGLKKPTAGQVWVDGVSIVGLDDEELQSFRACRIGVIPDFQRDFPHMEALTAERAVQQTLCPEARSEWKGPNSSREWLQFCKFTLDPKALIYRLYCTDRQKVAIARVMAARPKIIIADEPNNYSLTAQSRQEILSILEQYRQDFGGTIVLFTKFDSEAQRADRRFQLRNGLLSE